VFLNPILEYRMKFRTNSSSLFHQVLVILTHIVFDCVSHQHDVKYNLLVLRLVIAIKNNVSDMLGILCY
jgi:hypothetical protein